MCQPTKDQLILPPTARSAAAVGTLKPYCIFDGDAASPIGHWLVDNNVTLIRHLPSWREQLVAKAQGRMKVRAIADGTCALATSGYIEGRIAHRAYPEMLEGPGGALDQYECPDEPVAVTSPDTLMSTCPTPIANPRPMLTHTPTGQRAAQPPVQNPRHAGVHLPLPRTLC